MEKSKLRLGLLMDSFELPYWSYIMLKRIEQLDCTDIELVVLNDSQKPKVNMLYKIKNNWKYLLFILYNKVEDRLFRFEYDAFKSTDTTKLLDNIPVIRVRPRQTRYSDSIEDVDIGRIKKYQIDIFIRLGFRIL